MSALFFHSVPSSVSDFFPIQLFHSYILFEKMFAGWPQEVEIPETNFVVNLCLHCSQCQEHKGCFRGQDPGAAA